MKTGTCSLIAVTLAWAGPLRAELSFTFNFNDPAGVGFNDAALGATRRTALIQSGMLLGSFFLDTHNLVLDVVSTSQPGTLASAGSGFSGAPGFHRTFAQEKAISGTDVNGAAAEGDLDWNFDHNWDYDDNVDGGAFDFKSTAIHELCHALGFLSAIPQAPAASPDAYTIFDSYLTDPNGSKLINPATYQFDTSKNGVLTGGISGGVRFDGTQTRLANLNQPAHIFSPNPYLVGSSGSHLDDEFYTTSDWLMEAATTTGPGARGFSALETGMFRDLGFNAIPEPASATLLILGMPTLLALRRRV